MRFAEPSTVLTDYAIALQCALFARLLWHDRTFSSQLWSIGFGAIAVSALAGGTFHAIQAELPQTVGVILWQLTLYAIGTASFVIGLGTLAVSMRKRWQLVWAMVFSLKALVSGVLTNAKLDFFYVAVDYGLTLILILLFQMVAARRREAPALKWLLAGAVISGLAAWVLFHRWVFALDQPLPTTSLLSPEAIFHLIQLPGLYCLYRAARILTAEKQKSPAETARD